MDSPFPPEHIFTWTDLVHLIKSKQVDSLARTPTQLDEYHQWINDMRQIYCSTGDFIKHIVFGWHMQATADCTCAISIQPHQATPNKTGTTPNEEATSNPSTLLYPSADMNQERRLKIRDQGLKLRAVTPTTTDVRIIIRLNDFPYSLEQDITHYCLWSTHALNEHAIERHLRVSFPGRVFDEDLIWFMNPEHRKSIRDVWHVHVFIRK